MVVSVGPHQFGRLFAGKAQPRCRTQVAISATFTYALWLADVEKGDKMGLLGAVLPGFRTLRSPVIAGLLWLSNIVLYAFLHRLHFHIDPSVIKTMSSLVPDWFGVVLIPATLLASFLLGSVMVGITNQIVAMGIKLYRGVVGAGLWQWNYQKKGRLPGTFRRGLARRMSSLSTRSEPISLNGRALIIDYIMSTLTKSGVTGAAALIFPYDLVIYDLPNNSAQLSQLAPAQYQEYDRIQAEAEFRVAVVPPLMAMALQLSTTYALVPVGTAIACVILLVQSVGLNRKANDILASAARLGYVGIMQVQSLSELLSTLEPRPDTDGAWMAAMAAGLKRLGFFDENEGLLRELLTLDQEEDFAAAEAYLREHDPEEADHLKRLLTRLNLNLYVGSPAQTRSSASSPAPGGDQSADDPHASPSLR